MALSIMSSSNELKCFEGSVQYKEARSHSVQGFPSKILSPAMKIPLPPRLWITDIEDESSDEMCASVRDDGAVPVERPRVRSRFRHHKQRTNTSVPLGVFWDIENCQVPRGCSAIDVVAAIRAKFLTGRREAEFVVVCDVRKEAPQRLQELNDAQVNLIHVCGTQKNAADEKLRQCMRRFGELHTAPAALLLISGDINFAADLSDFRHRKNMEVILVHKQNTSSALIACASNHYNYNELIAHVPRNPKVSQTEEEVEPTCEMEVINLPIDQPPERVSRRLRRLSDNCGGRVLRVTASTATLRFPTPDHASRALKRMDGEDVFGRKIGTRFARNTTQPTYSSDEGYSTAPVQRPPQEFVPLQVQQSLASVPVDRVRSLSNEWSTALQQLPAPAPAPNHGPPVVPRQIRGTHGSSMDRSGCSSSNSLDDSRRELNQSRAGSPWNSSISFSEQSEGEQDAPVELTVSNLPACDPRLLQDMLRKLFSPFVKVMQVTIWAAGDGPQASVQLRSEWDARLVIARLHKKRLDSSWGRTRLELSLGSPSPAVNLDVLRVRLRAILLDQTNHSLPLLRLRDAYASRYCCALTTSDLAKVKDTVIIHEGLGRMVQLLDLKPVRSTETEETPWKCNIHAVMSTGHDDGSKILIPVYMKLDVLATHIKILLHNHGGIVPLLSFVECYEAMFPPLVADLDYGVTLELLLRSIPAVHVKDSPSRHITWCPPRVESPPTYSFQSDSSRSSGERERPRTAPLLEPMLALFERELIDLLRTTPRCSISFSKLIPAFHHHFGRQCRVADYGFTKLPDLLAALSNTIVVLGSGSHRVITISAAAQGKRWTSDLIKIIKAQPSKVINICDIPKVYQTVIGRPFNCVDYGVCTSEELMDKVTPDSVMFGDDGFVSLPRKQLTTREDASLFGVEAVELLCCTANLRMEFSRFVPAYHAHYGKQLKVSSFGCLKLLELFEMIPDVVTVYCDNTGERIVRVARLPARLEMAKRLKKLVPVALTALPNAYAAQYGMPPLPDTLDVSSLEALVFAAGGVIEGGIVYSADDTSRWASAALAACVVLSSDRSVARGSTLEYFVSAFRTLYGSDPNVILLTNLGVLETLGCHVRLAANWRIVWRLAQIVADRSAAGVAEIFIEFSNRYGPSFPNCESGGAQAVENFICRYGSIFSEEGGLWKLAPGVQMPAKRDLAPPKVALEDYSVCDTPPGQKGSRVFESPKNNLWCPPPASALPAPTGLLSQLSSDNKRRTRLAAQFDAA